MKNLWKLFAVSAFALVPVTANAATTVTVTDGECAATDMETLKLCNVEKVGEDKVEKISITGDIVIDESLTINVPVEAGAGLTVKAGKSLTINGTLDVTGDIIVNSGASIKVTAEDADTAVTAANIKLMKGTLTASANNANEIKGSENTAKSVTATKITVDGGALNAAIVEGAIVTANAATVKIDKLVGTLDGVKNTSDEYLANSSVITVKESISGAVTIVDKATLTAKEIGTKATAASITATGTAKATISGTVYGAATAKDSAAINAEKITGAVTVGAADATTGNPSVQYASSTSSVTVNRGIAKQTSSNDYGEDRVVVKFSGLSSISLSANETLVIDDSTVIPKDLKITAYNGAVIKNETDDALNLPVNNATVKVEGEKEYTVGNGQDQPTTPENPDTPKDPDKVPDVPKTGDTVLVSSALGLVSLIGLAATVKARKFN